MTTPDPELTGGAGNTEDQEPGGVSNPTQDPNMPGSGEGVGSNTPVDPAPDYGQGGTETPDPDLQPSPSSDTTLDDGGEAGPGGAGSSSPTGTPDPEQTATGTHTDEGRQQAPGTVDPETPNSGEGGSPRQADYPSPSGVTADPEVPQQP